jgi:hypothetical protein
MSTRPEVAAVDLLDVPGDIKARAHDLELQRTRELAFRLIDELDLVRAITDDISTGDNTAARAKTQQLRARIDRNLDATPLLDDMIELVGDAHAPELIRLVEEYHEALIDRRIPEDQRNNPDRRARVRASISEEAFQRDIRRAYDLSLAHYRRVLDAVYAAVEPTPEQRERIRSIVIDHIKTTRLEATPEQRRGAMRRIYDTLDDERKGKLFDYTLLIAVPGG